MFFADVVLQPNGIAAWLAVGLIVGWLAGKVPSEPTYGIAGDLLLASVGAVVGAVLFGFFVKGDPAWRGSRFGKDCQKFFRGGRRRR